MDIFTDISHGSCLVLLGSVCCIVTGPFIHETRCVAVLRRFESAFALPAASLLCYTTVTIRYSFPLNVPKTWTPTNFQQSRKQRRQNIKVGLVETFHPWYIFLIQFSERQFPRHSHHYFIVVLFFCVSGVLNVDAKMIIIKRRGHVSRQVHLPYPTNLTNHTDDVMVSLTAL